MEQLLEILQDWQTLLAGLLAVIAAFVAILPVRAQLKQMRVQSAIGARDILARRIHELETRKLKESGALSKVVQDTLRALRPGEGEEEIDTEWAFESGKDVESLIGLLEERQREMKEPSTVENSRKTVLEALRNYSVALNAVHAPFSLDLDDPDHGLTQQQKLEIVAAGPIMEKEVIPRLTRVQEFWADHLRIFEDELNLVRRKVRQIDEAVVIRDFNLK